MVPMSLFFLLLCAPALSYANSQRASPTPLWRRTSVPAVGFFDPRTNGGSWLTNNTGGPDGEPLNAVISAYSDGQVLLNQQVNGGILNYFLSFGFGTECLGQHEGNPQTANLGDGDGYLNQTAEIRWDYGNAEVGTCEETIEGGSHFRYWYQNGSAAESGAVFMAVSYETPLSEYHDIVFNGYNLGRDWLVGNVTAQSSLINTTTVNNASTYAGTTTYGGYTYHTTVTYASGYLENSSIGINHNGSVGNSITNAVDGLVAVLEVKMTGAPPSSSATRIALSTLPWTLPALLVVAILNPIAVLLSL
ncbi:hypothetical protein B0H21DRAFT_738713 [Amylocystis lapponica]|nr:hypothetical protein B0H21DRAFT_738713 [Amylocystis lapponica]